MHHPSVPSTAAADPSFGLAAAGLLDQYRHRSGGRHVNLHFPVCLAGPGAGVPERRLDMAGLKFAKVRRSQTDAIVAATGGLVARTVKLRGSDGPLITRFIQPFSGSGQYSGFVRSVGYTGKIVMGDSNRLISLMQQQILLYPDEVAREVAAVLDAVPAIAMRLGVSVDEEQCFVCPNLGTVWQLRNALRGFFDECGAALPISGFGPVYRDGYTPAHLRRAGQTAAALVWLGQESKWGCDEVQPALRDRPIRYPLQLCAKIRGTTSRYRVFDHKICREQVHAAFVGLAGIFSGHRRAGEEGHLNTEIANVAPWSLLGTAASGDFVLLNADCALEEPLSLPFLASLARCLQDPWRNGARILIVADLANRPAQHELDRLGLLTSLQCLAPETPSPMRHGHATPPAAFLLAMNFDPSDPQHALLAPPPRDTLPAAQ
jgi:hypothetical protein